MGMDVNMLACVRALAENRIQDAKKYAFCCCANDNTKKNESQVRSLPDMWRIPWVFLMHTLIFPS